MEGDDAPLPYNPFMAMGHYYWSMLSLKPVSCRDSEYRAADNIAEINLRGKLALYEKVFAAYGYAYGALHSEAKSGALCSDDFHCAVKIISARPPALFGVLREKAPFLKTSLRKNQKGRLKNWQPFLRCGRFFCRAPDSPVFGR